MFVMGTLHRHTMEEIVEKPASIADLERLETDIEGALISHIDKSL
jgi:hypothetical protein